MRATMSIWFFAGIMLLAYGIVILAAGLWELGHPLAHPPALSAICMLQSGGERCWEYPAPSTRLDSGRGVSAPAIAKQTMILQVKKDCGFRYAKTVNACIDCWKPRLLSRTTSPKKAERR